MNEEQKMKFMRDFYVTAARCSIMMIPEDECCQLLAWLLVCGGGCEKAVYDHKLNCSIMFAQEFLKMKGGETPKIESVVSIRRYADDLRGRIEAKDLSKEWIDDFVKKYNAPIRE